MISSANDLFPMVAAGAATTVAMLALLQTDRLSRLTTSPKSLMAKRRREYSYHWKTAVEKTYMQLDFSLAGGQEKFEADQEINMKNTNYLSSEKDQNALIQRILNEKESRFITLKIDKDPHDPTNEFYLFLMGQRARTSEMELFQAPLIPFCQKLREAFENQLTTTTLCFVADASAGKSSGMLETLVKEAKTGVAILSEPLWMVCLARLAEARLFATAKLQTCMFALSRLDSWALRETSKDSRTVMITLPGQATVPTLLPLAQAVFPEDRHVFCYDGCIATVWRSMQQRASFRRGTIHTELDSILYRLAQSPVRHAVPLPSKTPLTKQILKLEGALSQIPVSQAQVVEAWMGSVDTFLRLKDEEDKSGYLPYVFKTNFLTRPEGDFAPSSKSYWALSSLLQYVTGARSRGIPEGVMDSAIEYLKDYNNEHPEMPSKISEADQKAIENCVFQHKGILLGNKTLKDTVLPTQHWTLKQASRGGCTCCAPDPFDEQEEEEAANGNGNAGVKVGTSPAVGFAHGPQKTGYVDGKMSFAFDPTRFS